MTTLRVIWAALSAASGATLRRLTRGRRLPSWSFATEVMCAAQGAATDVLAQAEPATARRIMARAGRSMGRIPEGVREERATLGGVPVVRYLAQGVGADTAQRHVLYFHGGGYVLCSPATHAALTASLAQGTQACVTSVDYRLAPEHPYPAALDDALAAWADLLASGVRPEQVVVAGDSAGGNLTAELLLALRDHGKPLPAGAVLICPWVDLANAEDSFTRNADTDMLSLAAAEKWSADYRAGRDPHDPGVSPTHAKLTGLPPLLILAGGAEVLLDQIQTFAARAREAGIAVDLEVTPDMFHDWMLLDFVPESAAAVERMRGFVRARTG